MRAMVPTGAPGGSVRPGHVDEPEPAPDEVVVAVSAYSVNRGETFLLEAPAPGWRPGKDVAGTVVRAALTGAGPAVGTRVVAHPPSSGWAERVAVPVANLAPLPDSVDDVVASALPLAGLTALRLVRAAGALAGRRLLVTGASGGVGHYLVELAVAAGARVTAVSASAQRGHRLAELGATVVHDVPDAAGGGPFDVVFESVGGTSMPAALALLAPGGLLVWFGQASRQPVTLDFFRFFGGPNEARIRHFDYTRGDRCYAEDLRTLVDLVAAGRLHPEIGLVRDWNGTAEVLDLLRRRGVRGNAVLTLTPQRTDHPQQTERTAAVTERDMPATADARTVVTAYLQALVAGDADALRASFAEDATWTMPGDLPVSGTWTGPDQIIDGFLAGMVERLDPTVPVRVEVRNLVADGDQAVAEWTSRARSRDGQDYLNDYCVVFGVRDGRIAAVREYLDTGYARRVLFAD